MPTMTVYLLVALVVICLLPTGAWAFGAGDIPDFAYLNDKAFRHGDIENILEELAKVAGHAGLHLSGLMQGEGGLLGFAKGAAKAAVGIAGGSKFTKDDVKHIYFGNWLRDYSQAVDIAGLSQLSADTLVLVIGVLGFMTFGYATEEFQVTKERLGCYLPIEHIDNPKGYAEKEGDARQFDKRLRGPIDDRELQIDERTGMKNYMASENHGWDTSTAFIRRSFKSSIERARRANNKDCPDLHEAYRLLGQGLHTLEDLLAHSNWCEISLRKMGHEQVFCHVGDNVVVNTPSGPAPPLVTGTFGSADFLHSLLGEGMDKLSQTSMADISAEMEASKNSEADSEFETLKNLLGGFMSKSGGNGDEKLSQADNLKAKSKAISFDPKKDLPPEVSQQLGELLQWHDDVLREIESRMSMVPGLNELLDTLVEALNAYVFTLLTPYIAPILTQVSTVLAEGSKTVIDSDDQYAVFNNPEASDPSHSIISKDHFALILNEPAGKVARVLVKHTVTAMVEAWGGKGDPDQVINEILEAFHHPYYATGNSKVQNAMSEEFQKWFGGLGPEDSQRTLEGLTKEAVRDHRNKRLSEEEEREASNAPGLKYGHTCGSGHSHGPTGAGTRPSKQQYGGGGGAMAGGYGGSAQHQTGGHGGAQAGGYGGAQAVQSGGYGRTEQPSYGGSTGGYGGESRRTEQPTYGESRNTEQPAYGGSRRTEETSYGGHAEAPAYGGGASYGRPQEETSYGSRTEAPAYGGGATYGRPQEETPYGGRTEAPAYGGGASYGRPQEEASYGGIPGGYGGSESHGRRTEETSYGGGASYGRPQEETSYGGTTGGYGGESHGRRTEETSYGRSEGAYGGEEHGRRTEESSYGRTEPSYGGSDSHGSRREEGGHGRREEGGHGGRREHGGGDDDYGVGRLNIGGDDEEHGHGRRHRKHDDDE